MPVPASAEKRRSEVVTDKPRASSTKTDERGDVAPSKRISSVTSPARTEAPPRSTPFRRGEQRQVVRKYVAELAQQLSLSVGDVVLLGNERNGWLQGHVVDVVTGGKGASGWFPSLCVAPEPLVLAPPSPSTPAKHASPADAARPSAAVEPAATPLPAPSTETSTVEAAVPMRRNVSGQARAEEPVVLVVRLAKVAGTPLGVAIVGGKGTEYGDLGIFVGQIVPNSAADLDGRLAKGDQLLAVNGGLHCRAVCLA